jgi:hypothetical protein
MREIVKYLIVILFLVACTTKPENAIVGKWKEIDKTDVMEFFKEGSVSVTDKDMSLVGNYKFVDDGRLRLEIVGLKSMIVTIKLTANELIFTETNGTTVKFKRLGNN